MAVEQQVKIPKGSYKLRCLECDRDKSKSSDKPMLVQTWEIVESAKDYLNGIQIKTYQSLSEKAVGMLNVQRNAIGLPEVGISDLADLNANEYIGLTGAGVVETEVKEVKDDEGRVIVNPNTGKPAVTYYHRIAMWFTH